MVAPGVPLRMSSCGNHYGAQCNFSCAVGYRLNGSSAVTCVTLGDKPPAFWDNPLPKCQVVRCPPLPIPTHGVKFGCFDNLSVPYGSRCGFSCNVGYNLFGTSVRRCLENGTWSGETSSCQVINCRPLVPPTYGIIFPLSCVSGSNYSQTCRFACQTPGYVLDGTASRVCSNDGKWTGSNDTRCRDNTPPSFNNTCPNNMVFYTPECLSSALVKWNEPMAIDNSGHLTISHPAIRPPVNLSIGLYNVLYSASDSAGNKANCTFIVQVARKSCVVLQPPMNGAAAFSCGSLFGSQATLTCNRGYRLAGPRLRLCKEDGTWSGNTTTCNIVKCPAIATPSHGLVAPSSCTLLSGVHYKTQCFFMCNVTFGYRLEGGRNVSCLESGLWSEDTPKIICRDIQPPSIHCPRDMEVPTETGQSYARMTWDVPVPTDNSNEHLNLRGLMPPQKFNVGKEYITYKVTDSSGLSSTCTFSINIKDLEPPNISSCPNDIHITTSKKWTKVLLPGVAVTDNVGVHSFVSNRPNGSEFTWGEHNITYSARDKAGNTAICEFRIIIVDYGCPELRSPLNGAKACDLWLAAGKICTLHCNAGYDFAHKPPRFYSCGASRKWLPNDEVPECSKTRQAKTLLNVQLHYLADQCTEEMQAHIASNFVTLYTIYLGAMTTCDPIEECTIENVQVECADQTGTLRRRDIEESKKTSKVPLTVRFALKVPLPSNTSVAALNETTEQMSSDILAAFNKTDLNLNISGIVIEFDASKPPQLRLVRLLCDDGQVLRGTKCVNCPVGYFFNTTDCQACAVDQFQDQEAQSSCVPCPSGTSTFGTEGSKWRENCEDITSMSSRTEEQGFPKKILYSGIGVGSAILISLLVVTIFCARKHCVGGKPIKRKESRISPAPESMGHINPTYDGTESIHDNHPIMEIYDIESDKGCGFNNINYRPQDDLDGIS